MKVNENVEISATKGMKFIFHAHDNLIVYKTSPFSGKEYVEVNGKIVSESKNFRMKSLHEFSMDGAYYKITLEIKGLLQANITCSLHSNEKLLKSYHLVYERNQKNRIMLLIIPWFGGLLLGALLASEYIPFWVLVVFIAFVAALAKYNNKGKWVCTEQTN